LGCQAFLAQRVLREFRRAIYLLSIFPFLETILLCLSSRIRGYDDANFHIPSAAFTLHL